MNEEVLKDLYNRAVSSGYKKSINDFQVLLNTNKDVFEDSYSYVRSKGFGKDRDAFAGLVGSKKKETTELLSKQPQASGSLGMPETDQPKPLAPSTTRRKVKDPWRFNKSIESSDAAAYQKASRDAIAAAKSRNASALQGAMSTMKAIESMYGDAILNDSNLMGDRKTVEKLAKIPELKREQPKLKLPKNMDIKVSSTPLPEELEKQLAFQAVDQFLKRPVDLEAIDKEVDDMMSGNTFAEKLDNFYDQYISKPMTSAIIANYNPAYDQALMILSPSKSTMDLIPQEAKINLQKNGIKNPTKDEVRDEIRNILTKKKIDERMDKEVSSYFEGKTLLAKGDEQNALNTMYGKVYSEYEYHVKKFEAKKSRVDDILSRVQAIKDKPKDKLSAEDAEELSRLMEEKLLLVKDLEENYKNIESDYRDMEGFSKELDRYKRNYTYATNAIGWLLKTGLNITGGLLDIQGMVYDAGGDVIEATTGANIGENPLSKPSKILSSYAKSVSKDIEESTQKAQTVDQLNGLGDWASWAGRTVIEQSPQLALTYLTGGASVYLLGASSAGNKYAELEEQNKTLPEGEKKSRAQIYAASIGVGVFEGLSEKVELNVMRKVFPSMRLATVAAKEDAELLKRSLRTGMKGAALNAAEKTVKAGINMNQEGASELIALTGGNLVDKFVLGEKDKNILDGVPDAYLSGAVVGGAMTVSPFIASAIVAPFNYDPQGEIKKNVAKINELAKALELVKDDSDKAIITGQINKLLDKNQQKITQTLALFDSLSIDEKKRGIEIVQEMAEIKSRVESNINDPTMPKEVKTEVVNALFEQYNELVKERTQLLNRPNAVQEQTTSEVPVQPEAAASGEVAQGKSQAEPQVATEETKEEEIKTKSTDDLEKRLYEIEDKYEGAPSQSQNKSDADEYNAIEKELESREWKSVINSSLDKVSNVLDDLEKKEEEMPNGFGTFIQASDIRQSRRVVEKYLSEVSKQEAMKDFKDAFFGNPSAFYADALKLRESARAYIEKGGSMKDLLSSISDEFKTDGFTERDAAEVISNKLNAVKSRLSDERAAETQVTTEEGVQEIKIDRPSITSNAKAEVDAVVSAAEEVETGQTFNMDGTVYSEGGLVVPVVSENLTQEELTPERIADFLEANKDKIGSNSVKVGIYKFPRSNQVSIDLNIVVPKANREAALEFGRAAGQESLFDLDTFENVKTGADGKNPSKFTPKQFVEISKALEEGRVPDLFQKQQERSQKAAEKVTIAQNVSRAIQKLFPKLKTVSFKNAAEMRAYATSTYGQEIGSQVTEMDQARVLLDEKNQPIAILLNEQLSDATTMPHEAWHPILLKAFGDNQQLFEKFRKSIDRALREAGYDDIADRLDIFASDPEYIEKGTMAEEWLVQFGGMLVASGIDPKNLKPSEVTLFEKIKSLFNEVARKLTGQNIFLEDATPETILDFMASLSDMMSRGEDISGMITRGDSGDKGKSGGIKSRAQVIDAFSGVLEKLGIDVGVINKKTGKTKVTNYDIAAALNKYYEQIHKKLSITDFSDDAVNLVSDYAKDEILFAMSKFGNSSGKGWYTEDYAKALNILSKLDKDISKNKEIKEIATAIIAVASNSTDVYTNLTRVLYGIDKFKSTRKVPNDVGVGKGASAIASGIDRYNNILERFDNDPTKVADFLQQIDTISNLKKKLVDTFGVGSYAKAMNSNLATDPEWNDSEVLPMSILIFGPKIGAFYSNLSGLDGTPTIDRWCIRTVYRYRGDMRSKVSEKEMQDFKQANNIDGVSYSDAISLAQEHSKLFNAILTGRGEYKGMPKEERNAKLKPYRKGDQIWKKAQGVVNDISEGIESGVSNKKQYAKDFRTFTKKAFESARDKVLKESGEKLSVSDVQAILWIYEKNLFGHLGVKQREDSTYSSASLTLSNKVKSGEITIDQLKSGDLSVLTDPDISTDGAMGDSYGSDVKSFEDGLDSANERNGVADEKITTKASKYVPERVEKLLTEDGNGNFVFHHYSFANRDEIKPSTGDMARGFTSKEEAAALSSVGGLAMYYAQQDQVEAGVGPIRHTVVVPKDKVYYMTEDPLNFYDEAKERFLKHMNRGKDRDKWTEFAFNGNYQVAWISKVAAENGFDMVLSKWRNDADFRAQTVKTLKPIDGDIKFKDLDDSFQIGDLVKVSGRNAVITDMDENGVITYKSATTSGKFDIPYSQKSMRYGTITMIDKGPYVFNEETRDFDKITTKASKVSGYNTIPGYDRMRDELDGVIKRAKSRGASKDRVYESALAYMQKSAVYERADDTQREQMARDLAKELGIKGKSAPSVDKILGTLSNKKTSNAEKKDLTQWIKDRIKAAKDATDYINGLRRDLQLSIAAQVKSGKITSKQAASLIKAISTVNLQNPAAVSKLIDYANRVFERADYTDKLAEANKLRKRINKARKAKDNQAAVSNTARNFVLVDPKSVEDIEEYIFMATKMLEAVMRTDALDSGVKTRMATDLDATTDYIRRELKTQEESKKQSLLIEYQDLVDSGVIDDQMSYDEIISAINALEPDQDIDDSDKKQAIEDFLRNRFDSLKQIVYDMIDSKVNPVDGQPIDVTEEQVSLMKKLMDIRFDELSINDKKLAVEYLDNFASNEITDGVASLIEVNFGISNANKLVEDGYKSRNLKLFWSSKFGRIFGEQLTSLPMLVERMYGSTRRGVRFSDMAGINRVVSGVATGRSQAKAIMKEYKDKFLSRKGFNEPANIYERGIGAFLMRTDRTPTDFARRMGLVKQTIEKLFTGTEMEQKKAAEIQLVFDKFSSAKNIDDVRSVMSQENLDAVNWWIQKWSENYDALNEVSRTVYNSILGAEENFTPDTFTKVDAEGDDSVPDKIESAFRMSTKDYTVKKKTGVLMEVTKPRLLPKNMALSFDFDYNNSRAMEAALIDINTAGPIRQVYGFINSRAFAKMGKVEDMKLLKSRINSYIGAVRGKDYIPASELKAASKAINALMSIGAARALGGITQPIKQTVPVAINTLINAGRLDINAAFDADVNAWINKSGMPIANRGLDALTEASKADKYLDQSKLEKAGKVFELIQKAGEAWMKVFLANPDVFIARASFISYYKNELKKLGENPDGIDWTTHKPNQKALDFAQAMVDRQQNITDSDLAGDFMRSKDPLKQISRSVFFSFMNFVMNQKNRIYNDVLTISGSTASSQDKIQAARSLSAAGAEMFTYAAVSTFLGAILTNAAYALLGVDEPEEEKEKRIKYAKMGTATNFVNDLISPLPITNGLVDEGINKALVSIYEKNGTPEENRLYLFEPNEKTSIESLGAAGIPFVKLKEAYDNMELAATGKFEKEVFGKVVEKQLNEEDLKVVRQMSFIPAMYSLGLLPVEINNVNEKVIKIAKKRASSTGGSSGKNRYGSKFKSSFKSKYKKLF